MMDDWTDWQEHGAPNGCDAHYFAATINGARYTVTNPDGGKWWRAWNRDRANEHCDPEAGRIGREHDGRFAAMQACARDAGNGKGWHGYRRSRASLVEEANRLTVANGGPVCTFAACTDEEIFRVISYFRDRPPGASLRKAYPYCDACGALVDWPSGDCSACGRIAGD